MGVHGTSIACSDEFKGLNVRGKVIMTLCLSHGQDVFLNCMTWCGTIALIAHEL